METSKEAKEKAVELFNKMNVIHYVKLGGKNKNSKGLPVSMHNDQIKQCAIICVDEILNSGLLSPQLKRHYVMNIPPANDELEYWQQVKHEIQQL